MNLFQSLPSRIRETVAHPVKTARRIRGRYRAAAEIAVNRRLNSLEAVTDRREYAGFSSPDLRFLARIAVKSPAEGRRRRALNIMADYIEFATRARSVRRMAHAKTLRAPGQHHPRGISEAERHDIFIESVISDIAWIAAKDACEDLQKKANGILAQLILRRSGLVNNEMVAGAGRWKEGYVVSQVQKIAAGPEGETACGTARELLENFRPRRCWRIDPPLAAQPSPRGP